MSLDWIAQPISPDDPCGPDLEAADDAEFIDYYYDALARLPDPYFRPGSSHGEAKIDDRLFDPRGVDLKAELARIDPMLERSRDLRLLSLRAQWQILAGQIEPMAETVAAMADALETFGAAIHPRSDVDAGARRDALAELAQLQSVLQPLSYLPIETSGGTSLRKLRVAAGELTPQDGEDGLETGRLTQNLAAPENAERVARVHAATVTLSRAVARILAACRADEAMPLTPQLDPLEAMLVRLRYAIEAVRPDLHVEVAPPAEALEPDAPDETDAPTAAGAAPPPAGAVGTQAEARQALLTVEAYLAAHEPSSPALLLVTQARQLIGLGFMQALDILMPDHAHRAAVSFGAQGFVLTTDRLRGLSQEAASARPPEDEAEVGDPPAVGNGGTAANVLQAVEGYFQAHERSSPVPVLLQRARGYLSKDFQSLIDELIPGEM